MNSFNRLLFSAITRLLEEYIGQSPRKVSRPGAHSGLIALEKSVGLRMECFFDSHRHQS
jgi:hypothetical protein